MSYIPPTSQALELDLEIQNCEEKKIHPHACESFASKNIY